MVKFDDSYTNSRVADLHTQEEERYVETMAPQLGFNYINLNGYTINPESLSAISESNAQKALVAPFEIKQKVLSIAAKTPSSPDTQALFEKLSKQYSLQVYMCSTASLEYAWKRYSDMTDSTAEKKGVFEIDADTIKDLSDKIKKIEDVLVILKQIRTANTPRRISETIELVFAGGLALGSSDIHIEPEAGAIRLRYRFDGVLHDIADLESYMHKRMMSRIKLLSGMKLNSHAEAQDGRFTFSAGYRDVEVRSSVIPGALGESVVMRLLDPSVSSFSMERVNLNPHIQAVLERQLKKPNGLIITTGPTGSGKTTALYAFLQEVHTEGVKIITIENPVEYKLEGIVQTQTGEHYTFGSGLRAILRQDPDIIMIGEIRDREVAETAIHAAQTGHLVFSTLHTNSAVAGFARLMDLGVDSRTLGNSINLIMGQRLIRLLCEDCKAGYAPNERDAKLIQFIMQNHPHPVPVPDPLLIYKPVGCEKCGQSGFKGRAGIFEGVVVDEAVEEAVISDPREHVILAAAKPQGIPTMIEDGIEKVIKGTTSMSELQRVIELPYQEAGLLNEGPEHINPETPQTSGDDEFLKHVV